MFRMWCKIFKDNHLVEDCVIAYDDERTRTRMVFAALAECCNNFNIGVPIWLESNVRDFKRFDKVRFYQDNFIEKIDFDYLEIHVIEENTNSQYLHK